MKIGVIHPSFEMIAGAEKTTLSLLEGLKKTNHTITLYTFLPPNIEEENLSIHKIKLKKVPLFSWYKRIKLVEKLFDESQSEDVIVISSGGFSLHPASVKRILLYCHSTFEHDNDFVNKKFSGIKSLYYKKIQNKIKQQFEYLKNDNVELIANSNYTKTTIKKLFGKDSKIVIYPPVDIEKYLKFNTNPKKDLVITLNRISPEKNLDFAVDVIKNLDFTYILAGFAKHEFQLKYVDSLRKQTSDQKNISIKPNITSTEKEELLSTAKVYFHTAQESFGITVVETISAGCIPIVPNNSANVETVPFRDLRYEDDNVQDAKEKLSNAIKGKYDHFLPKLKEHIQNFTEESFQNKMISFIENQS